MIIFDTVLAMKNNEEDILQSLLSSYEVLGGVNQKGKRQLPTRSAVEALLYQIRDILFPAYFLNQAVSSTDLSKHIQISLTQVRQSLSDLLPLALRHSNEFDEDCLKENAQRIMMDFLAQIPDIRNQLQTDIDAIYEGDPASKSKDEVILCYPGFQAIMVYRVAHFLASQGVPLMPRMMTEIIHSVTGIDIHPSARIGDYFCIDHGTGIVIGETAIIGHHVKLYQGVTVGALSISHRDIPKKRHPTIEDHVTIYARTTILGGDTVIGKHTVIGGNAWITRSIPAFSKVYLSPDLIQTIKTEEDGQ